MSFFEVEFPTNIAYKRVGGPGFSTVVNLGFSGQEQRNRNWALARGKWTVTLETPSVAQYSGTRQSYVDILQAFFRNVGGKADAFRLKDHVDFQALSQPLVTYNGAVQLARTRTIGGRSYVQIITKPITSSVTNYKGVALANTVVLSSDHVTPVTVDYTTGIVTGQTAGTLVDFSYHYPVRFDTDELQIQVEDSASGQPVVTWASIPLVEVLPPNY